MVYNSIVKHTIVLHDDVDPEITLDDELERMCSCAADDEGLETGCDKLPAIYWVRLFTTFPKLISNVFKVFNMSKTSLNWLDTYLFYGVNLLM